MPKLKDIAEHVGTSIRTVGRALNDSGYVNAELKEQIQKAAAELGYCPNRIAQSLRRKRSFEVAAVIHSLDELHVDKLAGFETVLREHGFAVSVMIDPRDISEHAFPAFDELIQRRPAAVAIFARPGEDVRRKVEQLRAAEIPYVVIGNDQHDHDSVGIDRERGVYEAVCHLADCGHRRIAYLAAGDPTSRNNATRLAGYHRAMAELGLKKILIPTEQETQFEMGRNAAHALVHAGDGLPDAVQAYSDLVALGFVAGLGEHGLRVPEAVAVVGFDNRSASKYANPPLSTVAQPNEEVGRAAAQILLAKTRGESPPNEGWSRRLPTSLIRRETT